MPKPVPLGVRAQIEQTVRFEHTLTYHHYKLPPVYGTPDMIRLMETAAFLALKPYCQDDEISVGTAINVDHRAASGIGTRVKAEAELQSFDGRFYVFAVRASDDLQEIGQGTVTRAVVRVGKFMSKLSQPQQTPA